MRGARRVGLVVWSATHAPDRARLLETSGQPVSVVIPAGPQFLRELGADPPGAVVLDLDRRPSAGRDLALALRTRVATRQIPLVFLGGTAEHVAAIRSLLPDATFAPWQLAATAVATAMERPPQHPVVPSSLFVPFAGTPLPKKLGIRHGSIVQLLGAPPAARARLTPMPRGARWSTPSGPAPTLLLWFVRGRDQLARQGAVILQGHSGIPVWILWRKRSPKVRDGPSQTLVRSFGLTRGWVDYKICSFNAEWSGLLFRRRARPRSPAIPRGEPSAGRAGRAPRTGAARLLR
jgi:hypothetical protein